MNTLIFDTLKFSKKMKAVGFTEDQADTQAEAIAEIIDEQIATKRDLKELEIATKRDLKELEASMKQTEANLKLEIISQKNDLVRWVIGTSAALLGILFALIKLSS